MAFSLIIFFFFAEYSSVTRFTISVHFFVVVFVIKSLCLLRAPLALVAYMLFVFFIFGIETHLAHYIFFGVDLSYMCSHTIIQYVFRPNRNINDANNISQSITTPTAIAMGTQALTNNCYIKNVIINVGE